MSDTLVRFGAAGLSFLFIFASGYLMAGRERPFNAGILAIHKLVAVAFIVLLSVIIYQVHGAAGLGGVEIAAIVTTGLLFLGTIVFGALVTISAGSLSLVLRMHQVLPFLTVFSTAITFFLLQNGGGVV